VYSTQEVLAIAQEAEAEVSNNNSCRQPQERYISLEFRSDEDDFVADVFSGYKSDCIVVATTDRRMRLVRRIMHHIPQYTSSSSSEFTLTSPTAVPWVGGAECRRSGHSENLSRRPQDRLAKILDRKAWCTGPRAQIRLII
jgi:hypothetical protein